MSTNYSDTRFKTSPDGQRLRGSPPAPKVHVGMITRVLTRKVMEGMEDMPEARMVIAVIVQAIADCHKRDDRDRHDARRFLASKRLDFWCGCFASRRTSSAWWPSAPVIWSTKKSSGLL